MKNKKKKINKNMIFNKAMIKINNKIIKINKNILWIYKINIEFWEI
jgi:hypothetical protein